MSSSIRGTQFESFPVEIFAKSGGGGTQKPIGQGGGKPSTKKAAKKAPEEGGKEGCQEKEEIAGAVNILLTPRRR